MINNPYQTTALSGVVIKPVTEQLKVAAAEKTLLPVSLENGQNIPGLFEVNPRDKDIKPFNHPIQFESFGQTYTVIDTRAFVGVDKAGEARVTNPTEYRMAVVRGALAVGWAQGDREALLSMGDLPAKVFASLLTRMISTRLGLSPGDVQRLTAFNAIYYYSLFGVDDDGEASLVRMSRRVQRVIQIDPRVVVEILDHKLKLTDLASYCAGLKKVIQSPRLEALNPGLLLSMIGGIWFGQAAREIVNASFEYPPYFVAMCYIAATERGLNKMYLGKEVQEIGRRAGLADAFTRSINNYIEDMSHG